MYVSARWLFYRIQAWTDQDVTRYVHRAILTGLSPSTQYCKQLYWNMNTFQITKLVTGISTSKLFLPIPRPIRSAYLVIWVTIMETLRPALLETGWMESLTLLSTWVSGTCVT